MAEYPVKHLHTQITILDTVQELHALNIVKKYPDPVLFADARKAGLTKRTVRNVPDIMTKGNRLYGIFVQPQAAPDRSGDL
ncbi:MAG: hypothetical protein WCF90_02460 [Methanomicrobiales archaeon]